MHNFHIKLPRTCNQTKNCDLQYLKILKIKKENLTKKISTILDNYFIIANLLWSRDNKRPCYLCVHCCLPTCLPQVMEAPITSFLIVKLESCEFESLYSLARLGIEPECIQLFCEHNLYHPPSAESLNKHFWSTGNYLKSLNACIAVLP